MTFIWYECKYRSQEITFDVNFLSHSLFTESEYALRSAYKFTHNDDGSTFREG